MKEFDFKALLVSYCLCTIFIIPNSCFARDSYYSHSRHSSFSNHHPHSNHYGYSGHTSSRYYEYSSYRSRKNFHSYHYRPLSFTFTVPDKIKVYVDNGSGAKEVYLTDGSGKQAWKALKLGKYDTALSHFAIEAEKAPKSGLPVAGYALSTASLGNLDLATKLMRRAFRTDPNAFRKDPNSLRYLQPNKEIHVLIDNLISQFPSSEKITNLDNAFMLSVLNYLKHDYTSAKRFLNLARQDGDTSPSHINLEELVDLQLKGQKNLVSTTAKILNE